MPGIERIVWVTTLLFLLISTALAEPDNRVALVIGNSNYKNGYLSNAENDAEEMAVVLSQCRFKIIKRLNVNKRELRDAIRDFGNEIKKAPSVGLFYYAGHGVQVKGENFLVPIGADVRSEDEVIDECVMISSILRKMETAGNALNIIVLDACRDNPFKSFFRSAGAAGLAKMDAPAGSLLAYATAPGQMASDGSGRHGLYTSKLLKYIPTPGLTLEQLFKKVRIEVINSSQNRQIPWESSSLTCDFYFIPPRGIVVKKPEESNQASRPTLNNVSSSASYEEKTSGDIWDLPKITPSSGFTQRKTVTLTAKALGATPKEACSIATTSVARQYFNGRRPSDDLYKQSVHRIYCNVIQWLPNGHVRVEVIAEFYQ